MFLGSKINKKYAWEFSTFWKYRSFSEGVDFVEFRIELDYYRGDHKPSFQIFFSILNFKLVEFNIYNMHHVEDEDEED